MYCDLHLSQEPCDQCYKESTGRIKQLEEDNKKLKTIITKMFIASEDGGCINCLFRESAELTEEEKGQLTTPVEFLAMIKAPNNGEGE